MNNRRVSQSHDMFLFSVPGIDDWTFAVAASYVKAVTIFPRWRALPLMPSYVMGAVLWNEQISTIIDLCLLLIGSSAGDNPHFEQPHVVIRQADEETISWRIENGHWVTAPRTAPVIACPFRAQMGFGAVMADDRKVFLLNPEGIVPNGAIDANGQQS